MKDKFFDDNTQKAAYLKEDAILRIRNGKRGIVLLIALNHICHTLDYFVYPDMFQTFFKMRCIWSFLLMSLFFLLSKKDLATKYYHIIGYMWTMLIALPICIMVFLKDGSVSPYYAGLNLAIVGACQVLPYNHFEAMRYGLTIAFFYTIAVLFHEETPFNYSVFYNNLLFIMLTVIINVYICYFFTEIRIKEFKHRYKLEEMDKLKTEFYANINHELRTPLTMIISPIERILNNVPALPETARKLLILARNNGLRLLSLINDLLEILRLDELKKQIELVPIKISLLVSGIVNSVKYMFSEQNQRIDFINNCGDTVILGDISSLEKVLINILSNAAKFTPTDGMVAVSMHANEDNLIIKICDTGIGISEEEMPFIFERFRQVDGSSTRNYRGIGLGLAITKELLEEQNGSIKVASRKGMGTTFTITLPLYKGDLELFVSSSSNYDIFADTFRKADLAKIHIWHHIERLNLDKESRKYKIMIIDDEPDMCQFLMSLFEEKYITVQSHDGIRGIEKALEVIPDVIILDVMLPGMDGIKICKSLRSYPELEYTKIILLTARTYEGIKIKGLKSGADDFLTKPFSSTEVITRVENVLRTSIQQKQIKEAMNKLKEVESQLIQSEKLNSLGVLSAGIIHEINNPLNFMSGYVGGLRRKRKDSDPEIKEAVDNIYKGIERITRITSSLKKFASGAKRYEQPFYINDSLRSALTLTRAKIKEIKITDLLNREKYKVIGLPDEIAQVFINLLINAADAFKNIDRTPEITISSFKEQDRLFIKFKDNGCGIENSKLSHIFDPFFTTKETGEGMGLGLSICYKIVKNHGGNLNVNSKLDEFTDFIFDLPIIEDKEQNNV
ncbi:MAG: response regulator [Deltaproteobacteria bacterium]|nr:response regulator [Deltaproteobacteria bacterium]